MKRRAWLLAALLTACSPDAPSAGADFAGSAACQDCHAAAWRGWRESHHYQAMLPASEATVLGDFGDRTFEYAGLRHRFFRRDGRFMVETDGAEGRMETFEVAYTFGFSPLQQYLIAFPGGRYQALNIVWDSRPAAEGGQRWYHLYPDDAVTSEDLLHWTGAFQNWNSRCAACHSTGLEKNFDAKADRYATRWAEINVGCEACHGPGAAHVQWAKDDPSRPGPGFANALPAAGRWVAAPERSTAVRQGPPQGEVQVGVCASCHARRSELADAHPGKPFADLYQLQLLEDGLYYPDGQIRDEVYEYGSFLQSRMHAAGVACADCHDPHSGDTLAEGDALCARCHQPAVFDQPEHHHHGADSAGSRCVECHMPATTYMGVDARRDHGFRVPEPQLTLELGIPNACNRCHGGEDAAWSARQLETWYPGMRTRAAHAPVLAAARANDRSALPALLELAADSSASGVLRATALLESARFPSERTIAAAQAGLGNADPLVRAAAVRALQDLPAAHRYVLLRPQITDPARSVRTEVAAALAEVPAGQLPDPERAALATLRNEYRVALQHAADTPEGQLNLGIFQARSGQSEAAERHYRKALDLAPGFLPALINLADLYRENGLDSAAEPVLLEAVRRDPNHAPALHALGLLRVRQGQLAAAVDLLGQAARSDPANPRYVYVYGVALHESGRRGEAVAVLEAALARHPGDPDITAALAAYYQPSGDEEKLRRLHDQRR